MVMSKKAQITLFIIMGLLVLIIITYALFFIQSADNTGLGESLQATPESVKEYVEKCNVLVSEQAAYYIASHGGYYILPELRKEWRGYEITYNYQRSASPQKIMLSREQIARNYADFVSDRLPICTMYFDIYKQKGMVVEEEIPAADVVILDDKVIVKISYPVKITQGNQVYELNDYKDVVVPVRLGRIHDISSEITDRIVVDPEWIATSKIRSLMDNLGGGAKATVDTTDDTSVYILYDPVSDIIDGLRYEYVFGAKFD